MTESREAKSRTACKVILVHRRGGRIRFGLADEAPDGGFAAMPLPDLLGIDTALEAFAREALGLGQPSAHARFVERPHPQGRLYYLVEELAGPESPARGVAWLDAREALARLDIADRQALARAIAYLSGQEIGRGGPR